MVETRFSFKTRVGNGDSYIDRRRVLYIYAYRGSRRNAGRHRAATLFASRCIFLQARTHDAAPRRSNDATHEIRGERRALFFASTHRRREGKARIRVCNTRCNRHFILCPSFVSSNCSFSFPLLSTKCFFVFFSFLTSFSEEIISVWKLFVKSTSQWLIWGDSFFFFSAEF